MSKDLRSPLAKAWDEWCESEEGKQSTNWVGVISPQNSQYLKYRLHFAFLAGANAQLLIQRERILAQIEHLLFESPAPKSKERKE